MTEEYKTALLQQLAELKEKLAEEHKWHRVGYDHEMHMLVNVLAEAVTALLLAAGRGAP